jgi:2-oxo-4-hydroxy-4-carboxy-5-ureidoimidazoline decarboxylase
MVQVAVTAVPASGPANLPASVAGFDAADPTEAARLLQPCCASRRWIDEVVAGRPYGSSAALVERSEAALETLSWDDVTEALAAHPRIGEQAGGEHREAAWSRQEQAGAATAGDDAAAVAEQLRGGNVAYEQRFGFVFLICATGLSAPEMLAALRKRLGHDADAESSVVRIELEKIVRLRLAKAFG